MKANQANQQSGGQRADRYQPRAVATVYPWAEATLACGWDLERVRRAVARDQRSEAE